MKIIFENERQYNEHVDSVFCGPLTTREIGQLIRAGESFPKPRALDTEFSIASLRSLGRAPRQNPHDQAYYEGAARALDIMAWSKERPEKAGTARDLAMTHVAGFVEYFWRTPWRGYND